jgi:hypothetical protein
MTFNETATREKLKKQLGFDGIPDDELVNHRIQLNSPTGATDSMSLTVADYINAEVDITRQAYNNLESLMGDNNAEIPVLSETRESIIHGANSISTLGIQNIKYLDISFADKDTIHNFTVAISFDPKDINSVQLAYEQINQIKSHFTFVKERNRDELIGFETIISFYQYVNMVSGLINPRPLDQIGLTESIASRLSTIFEGADELDMIKKQFSL